MIFKYHSFEVVPWGAVLDVKGKSSTKEINTVINYSTSTSYTTTKEALGKNRSFFVESKKEPVKITYTVNSKNGDLVEIQTNLSCTTSKNSSGIITEFTLDNTNWFNTAPTTDTVQIQKKVQKVKTTLNKTPFNTNSNYLKFYINNTQVNYDKYEDNFFYFNTNDNIPINENSNIKAIYNIVTEIEENNITTVADSYYAFGRAYVSKGIFESAKYVYNITKGKEITNYNYSYDSTNGNYYYTFVIRTDEFSIGDKVKIKYRGYEKIQEDVSTVNYNSSYGKADLSKLLINSNNLYVYNITKNLQITSSYYAVRKDSTENKYYLLIYNKSTVYNDGDRVRLKYYYLDEVEETKKVIEDVDSTLHEATIPSNHKNLIVEECLDSNNYMVLFNRKDENTISFKDNRYDGQNITIKYEKTKPYVKLCCNNVTIETILGDSANNWSCDFERLDVENNYIYPKAVTNYTSRSQFARYAKISWNKSETQRLYWGETGTGGRYWAISGGSSDGYNLLTSTQNHDTTNLTVTIPAIKNFSQPYYYIVCTVNIVGCQWYGGFNRYIKSNFVSYTPFGYLKNITNSSKLYIDCNNNKIPEIVSLEKWGGKKSFYTSGNYYINPSDGLELYTDWYCDGFIPGGGDGCCEGGNGSSCQTTEKVYAQNKYAGGATGDRAAVDSSTGKYYRTGTEIFVSSGWYTVIGYVESDNSPVIPGPIALKYYSWDGSDY